MIKHLPMKVWTEEIDATHFAIIATVHIIQRGNLYGATIFRIIDGKRKWYGWYDLDEKTSIDWRTIGESELREHIRTECGGRIPYLGHASTIESFADRT